MQICGRGRVLLRKWIIGFEIAEEEKSALSSVCPVFFNFGSPTCIQKFYKGNV